MTSMINVFITSPLTSSERKIDLNSTVNQFKKKMEPITGIPPQNQKIWLYVTADSNKRFEITGGGDDDSKLSNFQITPYTRIHIEDTDPDEASQQLEKELLESESDTNNNGGNTDGLYVLEESEYDKMSNTVRKWKQDQKLGRFDPEFNSKKNEIIEKNNKKSELFKINDRCIINSGNVSENGDGKTDIKRLGEIKYIGKIPEIDSENIWIGVELDEPLGKNDGSIKGVRYFQCEKNYGSFVKPSVVEVGDFPKEDLFGSDMDEDEL
ncbi:unnamed protein product [[Candida] boidinii]|uniref:Unnamed protein product n=1 Tax=Candida boidinii TaxID=5477 RepID=A0A9W6WIX1_CANBO|nr:hypothetical protein B5S30_g4320 [[Candida] boidinii]GME74415.1 unnamed protein product [[Candida] boidinii]GMG00032.1 unnamed protein product [[Candida] boidinii]